MADVIVFASAGDYSAIYGAPADADVERLAFLLERASGYIMAYMPEGYERGADPVFELNASTVVCAMAHRVLCAPKGLEGVSQMTQTAGSYSASVSYLDQYMRPLPSELDLLGLGNGSLVVSARMAGDGDE